MSLTGSLKSNRWKERYARAKEEEMTVTIASETEWAIEGDSGNTHFLMMEEWAVHCTCEDASRNGICKHQIALNEWEIDHFKFQDGEMVDLPADE